MSESEVLEFAREVSAVHHEAVEPMGPTLAIDSSLGTSVAVSDGSRIVTFCVDDHLRHAEVVATLIARALAAVHLDSSQIQHVVAGMGPGPFTGLRVGIAAAHGFAAGRRLSVLPLVSHEAVALAALMDDPERTEARIVTDARRKEFFVTTYGRPDEDGIPALLGAPSLVARADLGEAADSQDPSRIDPVRVDAGTLIELAALRLAHNRAFEPDAALYLRSPDVTPSAGPKRVGT